MKQLKYFLQNHPSEENATTDCTSWSESQFVYITLFKANQQEANSSSVDHAILALTI